MGVFKISEPGLVIETARISVFFLFITVSFLIASCSNEGEVQKTATDPLSYDVSTKITEDSPSNFFGRPEEYLEWEAENTLNLVDEILAQDRQSTRLNSSHV